MLRSQRPPLEGVLKYETMSELQDAQQLFRSDLRTLRLAVFQGVAVDELNGNLSANRRGSHITRRCRRVHSQVQARLEPHLRGRIPPPSAFRPEPSRADG